MHKESATFTEHRPWGEFREYTSGEPVTVKTILVKHGEELSLQLHHKRSEFWHILSGEPLVIIGDREIKAKKGDEFMIGVGVTHRIGAPDGEVEFLEIAKGEFDENDIIRLEDNYGRS
jgi:mannose-6-phosphate isomerase